ncbi:hypothetical protein [Flaviflexus massiliensis]|uniref:hypothetical protein n=1 Tax=Flaviflexus massiliensis TaxID=1522309 RepID=UPI0006D56A62|nr:hypothetical protein [Flaviflexus massiliensis]
MTTGNNQNYGPQGQGNWGQQPPSAPSGQTPGYQQDAPYGDPNQGQYGGQGHGGQPPYGQPPQGGGYGQPPQGGGSKTGMIIAIVVVVLLALGAGAYFLFFNGDDEKSDDDRTTEETIGTEETSDTETDGDDTFTTDESEDPFGDETTADGGEETTDGDEQYGDPNADPAAFRAGMEEILAASGLTEEQAIAQGITAEQWDDYLSCVTDESLQRLTPEVIESISNGVDVYDSNSVSELSDIATSCGQQVGTL